MKVDQAKSASYTRRLDKALREGNLPRAAALNRARRRVDDRFDPAKALAGTARYLKLGEGALRPRGPRVRLLPHGDGQPGERAEGVRRRPALLRRALLRLHAAAPPDGLRAARVASATTPPTTTGSSARRARSCASLADEDPADASRAADADDSPGLLLDGAPPASCGAAERAGRHRARAPRPACELRPEALGVALYIGAQVRAISNAPPLRVTGADDGGWTFRVSRTLRLGATRRSRSSTFWTACRSST